ncbi:MAG: LamG-like jellyroll fold domain-containing protein [Mobilitalea sp.]
MESRKLGSLKSEWKAKILSVLLVIALISANLLQPTIVKAEEEEDGTTVVEEEDDTTVEEDNAAESTKGVTTVALGELVARWTFDSNYKETVSGITTEIGAKDITYTNGIYGKAAVFNGKDNYLIAKDDILNLGNGVDEDNSDFTISAWVNLGDSKSGEKFLVDKGEDVGWNNNDDKYWTNPYTVKFDGCETIVNLSNVYEDSITGYRTEGDSTTRGKYAEGNEWFLLTVTYDGSKTKIYHDNLLMSQSNYTEGITFNNDGLYIGVDGRLQNYYKGAVDDLRIYTKTLSYDEVNKLYENGLAANKELVEPTKKLVAYYTFDDDLKDSSSFKNDAEKVAESGTIKYVIGKNGKAITMSKGSYIRVPAGDQLNVEDEFTISFWLKLTAEGYVPVLCRQNPSNTDDNDNDWTYKLLIDSWSKGESTNVTIRTGVFNPAEWVPNEGPGLNTDMNYVDTKVKSTNWNHYTYTYQEGQMKFFLNGKLQNKSDKSDLINISNASGDLLIGYDGETFLNGAIDELKIDTRCASADEVMKEAKRVDSISLSSSDVKSLTKISKGKVIKLSEILLKDGDTKKISELKISNKNLSYKSSNKGIFTVSKTGSITAVKAGKAKITITYGGNSVSSTVIVK